MTETTWRDVHWDMLAQASREAPQARRTYTTKGLVEMCGVGKFLKRWKQTDTSKFPRCGIDEEDMVHVWRCKHLEVSSLWNDYCANSDSG